MKEKTKFYDREKFSPLQVENKPHEGGTNVLYS
jgi:hypothetical protein